MALSFITKKTNGDASFMTSTGNNHGSLLNISMNGGSTSSSFVLNGSSVSNGGDRPSSHLTSGLDVISNVMAADGAQKKVVIAQSLYGKMNHNHSNVSLFEHLPSSDVFHRSALFTTEEEVRSSLPYLYQKQYKELVWHVASGNHKKALEAKETGALILTSGSIEEMHEMGLVAHALSHALPSTIVMHLFDGQRLVFSAASRVGEAKKGGLDQLVEMPHHGNVFHTIQSALSQHGHSTFEYVGSGDAELIVVASGLDGRGCREEITKLRRHNVKVGLIVARVLRPWNHEAFLASLPNSTKKVACTSLDLFDDVASSMSLIQINHHVELVRNASGGFPCEFIPSHVTFSAAASSSLTKQFVLFSEFGLPGKRIASQVLGEKLGYFVQHFEQPGVKSEVRFGPVEIINERAITNADVVICENVAAMQLEVNDLDHLIQKRGTAVILNTSESSQSLDRTVLSSGVKRTILNHDVNVYSIDCHEVLKDVGVEYTNYLLFACAVLVSNENVKPFFVHLNKLCGNGVLEHLLLTNDAAVLKSKLTKLDTKHWKVRDGEAVVERRSNNESTIHIPPVPLASASYVSLLRQLFPFGLETNMVFSSSLEVEFGKTLGKLQARNHAKKELLHLSKTNGLGGSHVVDAFLKDEFNLVKTKQLVAELTRGNHAEIGEKLSQPFVWLIVEESGDMHQQSIHQILKANERNVKVILISRSTTQRDVGLYAMNYGGAYVASICLATAHSQAIKSLNEAMEFPGTAIIVAYEGESEKDSWPLYRWAPSVEGESKFALDSNKLREELAVFLKKEQQLSLMARSQPLIRTLDDKHSMEETFQIKVDSIQAKMQSDYERLLQGSVEGGGSSGNRKDLNLLVLYGSDSGNGAGVAESLAKKAESSGCGEVRCMEANEFNVEDLTNETTVVLVLSTAGQGEECANAKKFVKDLMDKKSANVKHLKFAVFGLGDSHYWGQGTADSKKYFCLSAKRVFQKLVELNAQPIVNYVGLGDDQNDQGFEGALIEWEKDLWKSLNVVVGKVVDLTPPIVDDDIKIKSNYLRGTIEEGLADTTNGKLLPEDCKITKFHGIYLQDNRDEREALDAKGLERSYSFLIRIGVPGGVCSADQFLQMDDLCNKYANGRLKCTTRQAFQFHGVVKSVLKKTMQGINQACLDTLAACGDVNRNVIANPEVNRGEVHRKANDLARAINAHLRPRTSAYHEIWLEKKPVAGFVDKEPLYGPTYLPRKFKIAVAVPPLNDVDVFAHCVGVIAIASERDPINTLEGYNICVGGGLGTTHGNKATYPRLSDVMCFCLPEQAVKVVECVMTIQRDFGERVDRKHARLKYTVEDRGVKWYREKVEERCGFKLQDPRPFKFESNGDNYGWRRSLDGKTWSFTMFIENGIIFDGEKYKLKSALRQIAGEMKAFKGDIILTANQNVILGNIPNESKARIVDLLHKWGVNNEKHSALRLNSMACVALPTCVLAMAESQRYLPTLIDKLDGVLEEVGLLGEPITIRMTGCPNGCARPYVAEIAFIGKAPGIYNLHLGGGFSGNRLNRIYKEGVNEEQILHILRPMLIRYAKEKHPGEHFGDFVIRVGIIMPVYNGRSFWAQTEAENDKTNSLNSLQIYW